MSHHHTLPPITYLPTPQPKKTEKKRKSRTADAVAKARGLMGLDEAGEVDEASDAPPAATAAPPPQHAPIEAVTERPNRTPGKLADVTLGAVLVAQEKANG
jgi:hypothetical protein